MTAGLCFLSLWQYWYWNMDLTIQLFFCTGEHKDFKLRLLTPCIRSGALSVKMSILLYLPGLLVITFRRKGLATTLRYLITIAAVQVLLAFPFLSEDPWSYLKGAFDLGRVFLYKWTVNWRFVDEPTFLSPTFALSLLVGHLTVLVAFGLFKWYKPDGGVWKIINRGLRQPLRPAGLTPTTPDCKSLIWHIPYIYASLTQQIRCCHDLVHIEPDWHYFRPIIALPILFVVCNANTFLGMENKIPTRDQVSISADYRVLALMRIGKAYPAHGNRVRLECISFYESIFRCSLGWEFVITCWCVVRLPKREARTDA